MVRHVPTPSPCLVLVILHVLPYGSRCPLRLRALSSCSRHPVPRHPVLPCGSRCPLRLRAFSSSSRTACPTGLGAHSVSVPCPAHPALPAIRVSDSLHAHSLVVPCPAHPALPALWVSNSLYARRSIVGPGLPLHLAGRGADDLPLLPLADRSLQVLRTGAGQGLHRGQQDRRPGQSARNHAPFAPKNRDSTTVLVPKAGGV